MGLCFYRSAGVIEQLSGFESWERGALEKKSLERIHLFEEAYENLNNHINYIKEVLENRLK